jgi:hypothetical protein
MKSGRGTLLICAVLAVVCAPLGSTSAAAASTVAGTWSCCGSGGASAQTWTIAESGGGLSGSASDGSGTFAPISGKISGGSVEIVTGPYTTDPGYTATFVGTISGETMSGTWKSNASQSGTWTATRTAGGSPEKKEERPAVAPASGKLPSATAVTCYYEFFSSEDTCTAQVAHAGPPPAPVPTGTVHFAVTSAGSFVSGPNCALAASAEAPAAPFCSVTLRTSSSELPALTAAYSGDANYAGSEGHTSFLGAGLETPKVATAKSGPGSYPGEVSLEVVVPTAKSELEATLAWQLGYWQVPPPADSALGKAFASIPTPPFEKDSYPAYYDMRKGLEALAYAPDQQAAWSKWNAEYLRWVEIANEYTANNPNSPVGPQLQHLWASMLNSAYQVWDVITTATGYKAVKSNVGMAVAATVKHKPKKPTVSVHRLALAVVNDTRAGKLKLHLHINRRLLDRIVGKRKQITVTAWVRIVPPASVDPNRVPVIEAKKLKLRR